MAPETVKPLPVDETEFTITAAVPVEDNVTDCVAEAFTFTLPKLKLEELRLSIADAAFNCRTKLVETPAALAEMAAVCVAVTAEIAAWKPALVAPADTVTDPGTTTAGSLLDRLTANPLTVAVVSFAVHATVPEPVIDPSVQLNEASAGSEESPLRLFPRLTVNSGIPTNGLFAES